VVQLGERVYALLQRQRLASHAVHELDSEGDELISKQGERLERRPVVERLGCTREHLPQRRFGAASEDDFDAVFADVQRRACAKSPWFAAPTHARTVAGPPAGGLQIDR